PGSRAERIRALLESSIQRRNIDLRRMSELQADVGSHASSGLIATALQAAGPIERLSIESREIAQLLVSWNGIAGADSVGAAAYHVFVENLAQEILDFAIGADLAARYRALPQVDVASLTLALMRSAIDGSSAVGLDAARVSAMVHESLRKTWLLLSFELGANRGKWRWGRLHRLSFRPFGAARAGSDFAELSELPYGGGGETINTAEFKGSGSFAVRVVSAFRFVVDASSPDQALVAIAPGQSEHPGHEHFRDGLPDWMAGRSSLLVTDRLLVRESGARRLLLEPVR
ncbi:MAG TPA: penicillin acylase family protein, partial [Myxococcota bacterium]|nr:penicillin acylase family protein [Myxococcota bacterium]